MDACRLFPQHVLVIIPLIGGVQMWWLVPIPRVLGSSGSSGVPLEHMMGAEVAPDHSWSLRGQWWWLVTTPRVWDGGSGGLQPLLVSGREISGDCDHSWPLAGQPHLEPLQVVSCSLQVCSQGKRLQPRFLLSPHAPPKQWRLASKVAQTFSAYTLSCGHTGFQTP